MTDSADNQAASKTQSHIDCRSSLLTVHTPFKDAEQSNEESQNDRSHQRFTLMLVRYVE